MRLAVDRQERSNWGRDDYAPQDARPDRGSEEYLRAMRQGQRRSEDVRDASRGAAKARESALQEQRAQTRDASEGFAERRARIQTSAAGADAAQVDPQAATAAASAGKTVAMTQATGPDASVDAALTKTPPNPDPNTSMNQLLPTRVPGAQESSIIAASKYGAVMTKQSTHVLQRPAATSTSVTNVSEVGASTQRTEALRMRGVVRKEAPQQAPRGDKLEQAREILDQVKVKISAGMQRATIELAPANLGRIGIKLEMRDNALVAVIRADKPEALAALEENLPELKAMLEESGITPGEFDLGLGLDKDSSDETPEDRNIIPSVAAHAGETDTQPQLRSNALAQAMARGGIDLIA